MGSTGLTAHPNPAEQGPSAWQIVTALVLDGIASRHTRRAYSQALEEFLIWFREQRGCGFNKASVQKYRAELEIKGLAPSSINVRLSAIRRLAMEAAANGLIPPELAAGIARARGAKQSGVRLGHWLTAQQTVEAQCWVGRRVVRAMNLTYRIKRRRFSLS
jgi:site-specific recombinase XerD